MFRFNPSKFLSILDQLSGYRRLTTWTRSISTTVPRFAEPPRKKRRIDPAVMRIRVERKLKKTEKEIERIENEPKQLIPILEYQYTNSEIRNLKSRPGRTYEDAGLTPGMLIAAKRLWSFYKGEESKIFNRSIRRLERNQMKALEALKELDEELYNRTLDVDDFSLIPFRSSHIRKETPSNPNYKPPDGSIKNVSKDWVM